jgi:hypothetical protein
MDHDHTRVLVFVLGGIAGAALDQIHVRSGALSYRDGSAPGPLRQPWWVAPQFGLAFVGVFDTARPAAAAAGEPEAIGRDAAWFAGAYLATGLFRRQPRALTAGLYLTWLLRLTRRRRPAPVAAYAAALAFAGSLYEHALSGTGAFGYASPELGNVPSWLPGLYLHGAPLAVDLASAVADPVGVGRAGVETMD